MIHNVSEYSLWISNKENTLMNIYGYFGFYIKTQGFSKHLSLKFYKL